MIGEFVTIAAYHRGGPTLSIARWRSLVSRLAHNQQYAGSNPARATNVPLPDNVDQGLLPREVMTPWVFFCGELTVESINHRRGGN